MASLSILGRKGGSAILWECYQRPKFLSFFVTVIETTHKITCAFSANLKIFFGIWRDGREQKLFWQKQTQGGILQILFMGKKFENIFKHKLVVLNW